VRESQGLRNNEFFYLLFPKINNNKEKKYKSAPRRETGEPTGRAGQTPNNTMQKNKSE